MANAVNYVYGLSNIESIFSTEERAIAETIGKVKLALLQKNPHSCPKLTLFFAIAAILALGGLFSTLRFAGVGGLNTYTPAILGGVMTMTCALVVLGFAIHFLKQNKAKKQENIKNIEEYKKEAKKTEETVLLDMTKKTIPYLLEKNKFFVIRKSDGKTFRIYLSSQYSQLLKNPWLEVNFDSNTLYKDDFRDTIELNLPFSLVKTKQVLSKDTLLEIRNAQTTKEKPFETHKIVIKDGSLYVHIEKNKLPEFLLDERISKNYSKKAISTFVDLLACDHARDFHLESKNIPSAKEDFFKYMEDLIGFATQAQNDQIKNFLEDSLCAMKKSSENVFEMFKLARTYHLNYLEESCFPALLELYSDKDKWNAVVHLSEKKLISLPSRIAAHDLGKTSDAYKIFDFSTVKQIVCDEDFSSLQQKMGLFSPHLKNLKHISVRQKGLEIILPQVVMKFISFCEARLPSLQVLDFLQSSFGMTAVIEFKSNEFSLYNERNPIIVRNSADTDELFKQYKIRPKA